MSSQDWAARGLELDLGVPKGLELDLGLWVSGAGLWGPWGAGISLGSLEVWGWSLGIWGWTLGALGAGS